MGSSFLCLVFLSAPDECLVFDYHRIEPVRTFIEIDYGEALLPVWVFGVLDLLIEQTRILITIYCPVQQGLGCQTHTMNVALYQRDSLLVQQVLGSGR